MEAIRSVARRLAADYPFRVKLAALTLLFLTALLNNFSHLRGVLADNPARGDEVALADERFARIKEALPARGVIGYVDDRDDATEATKHYYLTQHALAPLIVTRGAGPDLVVGNFSRPESAARAGAGGALTPVGDFGRGVILFRRSK